MRTFFFAALVVLAAQVPALSPAVAQVGAPPDPAALERVTKAMWPKRPEGWENRISYDETQAACSRFRNELPQAEFERVRAREAATIRFPADGNVLGDWKAGQKYANDGRGGTFTDRPMTNGANCYACHQMDLAELSYGTLGPPLVGYGKLRNYAPEEARAAYAKIYNSMATMPCSTMPRFGYHGFLTEQQMKDLTAFLFDPASPVNK
ncbi:MAG: sulfur oxidation c-type cytochrome SoxX [Hyphomicrobiales bacterium]|uniref:sulfur oxidation c-type cytochrome SoxX n=1 Tax=Rhabdaerophilum calidifontis TaxID=2604328 RepID=UPI00123C1D4A|nr:sulfur oxidation c-type cytochrome SoxX [Rhabdaerophilum calidifontis]MCA1952246.1 sulfur oxidation c-type cytochrome SoxX [Hyphomicrobiales bacterium]MCA1998947.1 sulfur oxidation c-type cytochrome SoxX [Hyphomicrobiales bacterium]